MRRPTRASNQTTCYVIAYDIPDDKRRTKIHKILLGYGKWTQYSLFECFLTRKELVLLRSKLAEHLVAKEDSVRFYPLCANCVSKVETVGGPPPADAVLFLGSCALCVLAHAAFRTFWRKSGKPLRPYMERLIYLSLLI